MTIKDLFDQAANGAGTKLEAFVTAEIAAVPDSATSLQPLLDILHTDVTAEGVAKLIAILPAEVFDLLHGHFNPRRHAGDAN